MSCDEKILNFHWSLYKEKLFQNVKSITAFFYVNFVQRLKDRKRCLFILTTFKSRKRDRDREIKIEIERQRVRERELEIERQRQRDRVRERERNEIWRFLVSCIISKLVHQKRCKLEVEDNLSITTSILSLIPRSLKLHNDTLFIPYTHTHVLIYPCAHLHPLTYS